MLFSYPEIRTRYRSAIEAWFVANGCSQYADFADDDAGAEFVANQARFRDGTATWVRYGVPVQLAFGPADCFRLAYSLGRGCEISVGGEELANASSRAGYLIGPGTAWQTRNVHGIEEFSLCIPRSVLTARMAAYTGAGDVGLDLCQPSHVSPQLADDLRQTIFDFAGELQIADPAFLPHLSAEALDGICLRMIEILSPVATRFDEPPPAPSSVQIALVEQHLVAHFSESITLETLARVSGVSARSVLWHFRLRHGCSPQQYLARIRLQMAHLRLRLYGTQDTVETVALTCGFPNLDRFTEAYRHAFGMSPTPKVAARP